MEETKEVKKLNYEELEKVALQLQRRVVTLESQLNGINAVSFRLNYLFKVLDNKSLFSEEFVNKCVQEIVDTITIEDSSSLDTVEE